MRTSQVSSSQLHPPPTASPREEGESHSLGILFFANHGPCPPRSPNEHSSCSTAFGNPTYGGMLLKTSMSLSEALAQLTMMLNKRPDLTSRLRGGDEESRKSVAEMSAEIIQKIFTICLTDRSSARFSMPEGKKVGVYMFANLVLKLLFAVRSTVHPFTLPLPPLSSFALRYLVSHHAPFLFLFNLSHS